MNIDRPYVPQGFILYPILFFLFKNDILAEIKLLFDDTSLILDGDNPIQKWTEQWFVNYNAQKTQ